MKFLIVHKSIMRSAVSGKAAARETYTITLKSTEWIISSKGSVSALCSSRWKKKRRGSRASMEASPQA
jgi:hypothetical protein